jgi:hypothetical protein
METIFLMGVVVVNSKSLPVYRPLVNIGRAP